MKKVISIALTAVMLLGMIPIFGTVVGAESLVRDTEWYTNHSSETTFEISTPSQLLGFSDLLADGTDFTGKTFKLTANITLNDGWSASSNTSATDAWANNTGKYFKGTFDGQGHKISGIYLNTTDWNVGIFGRGNGATVKNLIIENSYVKGAANVGSVFGITSLGDCTIENVQSSAYVTSSNTENNNLVQVGGLVGCAGDDHTLDIKSCVFSGTLTVSGSTRCYGGLIGKINASATANVTSSAFYGSILSNNDVVGGIAARLDGGMLTVTNCISAGTIQNTKAYGGAFYGQTYTDANALNPRPAVIMIKRSVCTSQPIGTYDGITAPNAASTYTQVEGTALKALDNEGLGEKGLVIWQAVADSYPLTPAMSALLTGTVVADQSVSDFDNVSQNPTNPEDGKKPTDSTATTDPTGGDESSDEPETEAEGKESTADNAEVTTEVEENRGCSSTALGGITVVALVSCIGVSLARKKRED